MDIGEGKWAGLSDWLALGSVRRWSSDASPPSKQLSAA
jgi:hypothetical protein